MHVAQIHCQILHILDMCLGAYPPKTDMHSGLIVRHKYDNFTYLMTYSGFVNKFAQHVYFLQI